MSIHLNTDTAQRSAALTARLQELTARKAEYEALALSGELSPAAVTELEGERRFAEMRAEAAERAAKQEREALASNEKLTKALNDFLADDDLSVDPLKDALSAISEAVAVFMERAQTRDAHVKDWNRKLRSLGVPDQGLTVDGLEVSMTSNGQISVDGRTVNVTSGQNALVVGALPPLIGSTRLDSGALDTFDRRQEIAHLEVRVVKAVGAKSAGDVLSTRKGFTASQLARMVHSGHAELVAGEVPEPDLTEQQLIASRAVAEERQAEIAATRMP
jgi:hypothetical protein